MRPSGVLLRANRVVEMSGCPQVQPGTAVGRWLGFVTAVWVQCMSGNNYTFSNYSDELKALMGLTQLQLNNLSVAKDLGQAFGLLAGLASDNFHLPAPALLLVGSLEGLIGYGAQWLVVRRSIPPPPYWLVCVYLCMGGNSTTWMNTAVLVTCMRNFGRNRGPVSGILKGHVGLSTALFTNVYSALFPDDPTFFILMLAVAPAVASVPGVLFLREVPLSASDKEEDDNRYFCAINAVSVVIAVYLLSFDVSGHHQRLLSVGFAAGLLVLLLLPLGIPIYIGIREARNRADASAEADLEGRIREPLMRREERKKQEAPPSAAEEWRKPTIGEEQTIWEAMRTMDFWILFVSFLCGAGTGLAVMNNMGQMARSMGYSDVSIFVSMTSIWGFFGRIGSGSLSEYFLKKMATPRPVWNALSLILMAFGYVFMAMALPASLYVGSIVVGICYGVRLAITVPIASELFGLKYYGLLYNIIIINLPLGSFLFSGLLAGFLYDAHATTTAGGGNVCVGTQCYRLVFVVMIFACIVGFGLDLLLAFRTKKVYIRICFGKGFT